MQQYSRRVDGHLSLHLLEYFFPKYKLPVKNIVSRTESLP